jgi:hypothetical protein
MLNFLERAKQLRDDQRLGLSAEDHKTFGRVFQRLSDLRLAQAKMVIDIENIEHLFSLLDMDIEFGGAGTEALRRDLILLILRTLERTIRTDNLRTGPWSLLMKSHNGQKSVRANYVELFSGLASRRWIGGAFGIPESGKCQDAIITMNYDCLVDDCLIRFGVQPDYGLEHVELPEELTRHVGNHVELRC